MADGDSPNPQSGQDVKDFDSWLAAQPKDHLEALASRVAQNYDSSLREQFKDIVPLIERADKDENFRKRLSKLTDEQFEKFMFETALPVYERSMSAEPGDSTVNAARDPELSEVRKLIEEERAERKNEKLEAQKARYAEERAQETRALISEFPELAGFEQNERARKRLTRVLDLAESRSVKENKRVPYRTVYEELRDEFSPETLDTAHFRSVPSVSTAEPPASPQAPRTAAERKDRTLRMLQKAGGFSALARMRK